MPGKLLLILDVAARRFYEKVADRSDRRRIDNILGYLLREPYADQELKVAFPFPPFNALIYYDSVYWVIYRIDTSEPDTQSIIVLNMGYADEEPSTEREEPLL